jgi:hypothetical protein
MPALAEATARNAASQASRAKGCDDSRGRLGLRQRGEAAQISIEQHRPDGLADFAPQRPRQHARGAAPAEIGFQHGG